MPLKIARRSEIAPFLAMDVLADAQRLAARGREVLHLEVGEPGEGPPPAVIDAACAALRSQRLGYTEALGIRPLRHALAMRYGTVDGLEIEPDRIIVTSGASGAFVLAFMAAFDPGDRVVVPEPAFPAYRNVLEALGIEVVRLELGDDTGFRPTPEKLDQLAGSIHGLVIASPANPTGTMLSGEEINALALWCRERRVRLVSDEIYHGLSFREPAVSALAHDPQAIVINGFSKYFAMTGWRLGWMVVPPDLLRPIERLAQNLYISASAPGQYAALAALHCSVELDKRIERYRANRDLLTDRLIPAGLDRFAPPDGAFYLYVDTSHLGPSVALCRRILEETGVALTPGVDFDRERGESFVRFAFCGPSAAVDEAGRRLATWLAAR